MHRNIQWKKQKIEIQIICAPIRATLRLVNNGTGEIKENEVFMGDFPLMTDSGTFIINGARTCYLFHS